MHIRRSPTFAFCDFAALALCSLDKCLIVGLWQFTLHQHKAEETSYAQHEPVHSQFLDLLKNETKQTDTNKKVLLLPAT